MPLPGYVGLQQWHRGQQGRGQQGQGQQASHSHTVWQGRQAVECVNLREPAAAVKLPGVEDLPTALAFLNSCCYRAVPGGLNSCAMCKTWAMCSLQCDAGTACDRNIASLTSPTPRPSFCTYPALSSQAPSAATLPDNPCLLSAQRLTFAATMPAFLYQALLQRESVAAL
jgi:hypothetical protein